MYYQIRSWQLKIVNFLLKLRLWIGKKWKKFKQQLFHVRYGKGIGVVKSFWNMSTNSLTLLVLRSPKKGRHQGSLSFSLNRYHMMGCLGGLFFLCSVLLYGVVGYLTSKIQLLGLERDIQQITVLRDLYEAEVDIFRQMITLPMVEHLEAIAKQVNQYQLGISELFVEENASFPDKKKSIISGIGGRELSLSNLPKAIKTSYLRSLSFKGGSDFLKHSKYLLGFFEKHQRFIHTIPTQMPIKTVFSSFTVKGNMMEFQTLMGTEVLASAGGIVKIIRRLSNKRYTVILDHEYGYITEYHGLIHLQESVRQGMRLRKAQPFAYSSDRLRYQVRLGNQYQNPTDTFLLSSFPSTSSR